MWAGTVVNIGVYGAIKRDLFRLRVDDGITGSRDEAYKDVVACVDRDGAAVVVYGHGFGGLTVEAEGAVHACASFSR